MNSKKDSLRPEFADVERHHLVPGIFQVCKRNKTTQSLDLRFEFPDGHLDVVAGRAPRPFDAVLLCAILCHIAQDKKYIYPDSENPLGQQLRADMELLMDAARDSCLAFYTSFKKLAEYMGIGWHGKATITLLKESLIRLFTVSFILEYKKNGKTKDAGFHLISWTKLEEKKDDSTLAIAINPVLAEALIDPGHYARIDMQLLKNLSSNAQLLYIMLCNSIDQGKIKGFTTDELRLMLYGNKNNSKNDTISKQKSRAKKTTFELVQAVGWEIEEKEKILWIKRPMPFGQKNIKK